MMGYDMSWASFGTVEVMSSCRFDQKRIGYLAASQGFNQDTDVILLTTNLLKKELRGANSAVGDLCRVYEAGLAVNCLSNIVTEDLARELLPELTALTSHPNPYLRKKAVLCMFKLFTKYPQALRLTFDRIRQCLDDPDPAVVSSAVNVITELSDVNPRNYLQLAPQFFRILTTSSNNWMLIKVVKLLGSLVSEEPRLARKLLEPLSAIVKRTQAKSLLYEAVYTLTLAMPYCRKSDGTMPASIPQIVQLCSETLRSFLMEEDQNLRYLGLVGFASLTLSSPRGVLMPHRELILACLCDEDATIRTRALHLVTSMASRKNLMELVSQLMRHIDLAEGQYKAELVKKIVFMCSMDKYALLQDFTWYLSLLVRLAHIKGFADVHGELIRSQIVDVSLRVLPVREYAVGRMIEILLERDGTFDVGKDEKEDGAENKSCVMKEIFPGAAWIVGEYSRHISARIDINVTFPDYIRGPYHAIIKALLSPSTLELEPSTQAIYVHSAGKVFVAACNKSEVRNEELEACVSILEHYLVIFMESSDPEVQERTFSMYQLLKSFHIIEQSRTPQNPLSNNHMDNDDDESVQEKQNLPMVTSEAAVGDLLSLGMPTQSTKKNPAPPKKDNLLSTLSATTSTASKVASKCREAAKILEYILTQDPMKPVSAKAQKKKRQSPGAPANLETPVDVSVFRSLTEAENDQQKSRASIEEVSFTRQRPSRTTQHFRPADVSSVDDGGFSGDRAGTRAPFLSDASQPISSTTSFQNSGMLNRENDAYYLNTAGGKDDPRKAGGGKFGIIQLVDDDDVESRNRKKKSKKNKKKEKKKRENSNAVSASQETEYPDLSIFDKKVSPVQRSANVYDVPTPSPTAAAIYRSDDDDDEEDYRPNTPSPISIHKRGGGASKKGFNGLASVDLTVPLQEDEVMPVRQHRQVPDKQTQPPPEKLTEKKNGGKKQSKKHKKKEKKNKKNRESKTPSPATATTGDLLGFDSLYTNDIAGTAADGSGGLLSGESLPTPDSSSMKNQTVTIPPSSTNAISFAFDDLLGLDAPAPVMTQTPSIPQTISNATDDQLIPLPPMNSSSTKSSTSKRPWIKASLKPSGASGAVVDWENVVLHFKAFNSKGTQTPSATIHVRVTNRSDTGTLQNTTIALQDFENAPIGNVSPARTLETSDPKIGPFAYGDSEESCVEVRGSLLASGGSIPVKLFLPAAAHLRPVRGLSQDTVMDELSIGRWYANTVKLNNASLDPDEIVPALCAFLRACEVDGEGASSSPSVRMLAARSNGGKELRVLVKVKTSGSKRSVKVDLKCRDEMFGKAIANDLKRVDF